MKTKAQKPVKVVSREPSEFTMSEVEIVTELCTKFGWETDIKVGEGDANIGHFYVEKWNVQEEHSGIGKPYNVTVPEYVLHEEVVEYNYPHEPDFSDSVKFDTIQRSIYDVMGRLWMREKEYEIANMIEGYAMHREYEQSKKYEEQV
jgi:hypothetical protein